MSRANDTLPHFSTGGGANWLEQGKLGATCLGEERHLMKTPDRSMGRLLITPNMPWRKFQVLKNDKETNWYAIWEEVSKTDSSSEFTYLWKAFSPTGTNVESFKQTNKFELLDHGVQGQHLDGPTLVELQNAQTKRMTSKLTMIEQYVDISIEGNCFSDPFILMASGSTLLSKRVKNPLCTIHTYYLAFWSKDGLRQQQDAEHQQNKTTRGC